MLQSALALILVSALSASANREPQQSLDDLPVGVSAAAVDQQAPLPSITVEGEVNMPGTFPWREGMRLSDALLAAGRVKEWPSRSTKLLLLVTHADGSKSLVKYYKLLCDTRCDSILKPGDKINVKTPKRIF